MNPQEQMRPKRQKPRRSQTSEDRSPDAGPGRTRVWWRLPHELGQLPLTYYQTLVDALRDMRAAEDAPITEDDALDIDVDAMIRKGRRTGFGASA